MDEHTTRVRYGETDRMGVVYHANYFLYFEAGRTEYMRRRGIRYRDLEEEGILLSVTRVGAVFHAGARYDDLLTIRTGVTRLTKARIRFEYEILGDTGLLAEGFTELACVDGSGRPRRIPARVVESIEVEPDSRLAGCVRA